MRVIAPGEFRRMLWKNGGGITADVVRWGGGGGGGGVDEEDYDVRVSLADVAAVGPFSRFPGYRRWSFLATGTPVTLEVAGVAQQLVALGDHLEVGGDVAIVCALPAGPSQLLNVLVRDGAVAQVGHGPSPLAIRFAFALAAMPWLPAGHAAMFDPPERMELERHAVWLA